MDDDTWRKHTHFDGKPLKEDTETECSLGMKGVVYEAEG